jgi:hypothetical protein
VFADIQFGFDFTLELKLRSFSINISHQRGVAQQAMMQTNIPKVNTRLDFGLLIMVWKKLNYLLDPGNILRSLAD